MNRDPLIPMIAVVTDIRVDTPDVKTFRVVGLDGRKPFSHIPGQCAMLSVPGVGEALFSITSSPTDLDFLEFSIKKCGCVTEWLHAMEPGQQVTLRGPYGIGLAPLRSVIRYVRANRSWYGQVDIVYGARSRDDLVDYPEIVEQWCQEEGLRVHLTIDREQPGWDGHVGFVPGYVRELGFDTGKTAVVCGPPVMIQFTLEALQAMGFQKNQVYTTLELRMKCGTRTGRKAYPERKPTDCVPQCSRRHRRPDSVKSPAKRPISKAPGGMPDAKTPRTDSLPVRKSCTKSTQQGTDIRQRRP